MLTETQGSAVIYERGKDSEAKKLSFTVEEVDPFEEVPGFEYGSVISGD